MKDFLLEISKMVVITGSYAEGTQNEFSDIDLYIKNEKYVSIIIKKIKERNLKLESCYPLTFATYIDGYMLDFSALFEIGKIFKKEFFGIEMEFSKSTYQN